MTEIPRTYYATAEGDVHVAYQVVGGGPVDLVFVPPFVSNLDIWWEFPEAAGFLRRLASSSRLIVMDKRGTGLSDRLTRVEPMEERADDVRAVMDAAGSEGAVIFSASEGAPIAALFAATYPARVRGLFLWGSMARWSPAPDYPWAATDEAYTQIIELAIERWGTGITADFVMPSRSAEPAVREWFSRYEKASASPGAFAMLTLNNTLIDVRAVLPMIQTPARILHAATDTFVPVEAGRLVASRLPNCTYDELPGSDHAYFGAATERLADELVRFLAGPLAPPEPSSALASVMVVEASAGGRGASERPEYKRVAAREVTQRRGKIIRVANGELVAWLPGPARALRCADAIRQETTKLGLSVRAGVHTGEFEMAGELMSGSGVDFAVTVKEAAHPGEILATSTVRDLVAGSGIHLEERGSQRLRGALGSVDLVAVVEHPSPSGDDLRVRFEEAVGRAVSAERPAPTIAPLSRRQSEVAYLISCGLSNRAIGHRLFLSERTVENHVYNTLARLEFDSRTQLAAWVARRT